MDRVMRMWATYQHQAHAASTSNPNPARKDGSVSALAAPHVVPTISDSTQTAQKGRAVGREEGVEGEASARLSQMAPGKKPSAPKTMPCNPVNQGNTWTKTTAPSALITKLSRTRQWLSNTRR